MKLYEIDEAILECIDEETGEVLDSEKLELLNMTREKKIEGVALWVKNLKAEEQAVKAEKQVFEERQRKLKSEILSRERYLAWALESLPFSTPKVQIKFSNSTRLKIIDESQVPDEFKILNYTISKSEITRLIKTGAIVSYAQLEEHKNINIK